MREEQGAGGEGSGLAEREPVAALRAGDEAAFVSLVAAHNRVMLRVALHYVGTRSVAEEVVQDTWLALLNGLDRFEQRSSLKTWLLRVLANIARTRAVRERRSVPMSALAVDGSGDGDGGPTVDPARFRDPDAEQWPRHWMSAPRDWRGRPELVSMARETLDVVRGALEVLPERQRMVVALRDVEGLSAEEVCAVMEVTPANQRVLLHRGRAHVRQALEHHLAGSR